MKKSILSAALLATPIMSNAAGFALIEQSGSGMGNAYAGAAAVAEDASTIYFNPAGMTYIEGTQVVGALHLIKPSGEFNNEGSVAGQGRPLGGEGGNIGDLNYVPNFYYKRDISDAVKFGLGINAPFGLKTEYDKDWLGRFQGIKSDLKTVNINPALAFKVNDQLSVGFGINAMWIQAELTSAVNLVAAERTSKVKGDDWGFGYNLGAIYQITPDTRLGLAYRSKVDQHLKGDVKFSVSAGPTPNGDVNAAVTLPETLSLSSFTKLNDTWDLLADVTWTKWSRFRELAVYRDSGALLTATPENWNNTMRYSIALNYKYSDTLKLRAGLAYDEEAIDDEFRTVRIPGNDRKWLALGAGWQATPNTKLDIGYAHLFISDPSIDDNQSTVVPGRGRVTGDYDASVDMVSLQVTHNF
jgi:long-chain fatty acid transport protein